MAPCEGGACGELPNAQSTAAVKVMPSRAKGFTRLAVPSLAVLVTAGTLSWPSAAQAQTPGFTEGQLYALLSQAQQSATTSTDETSSPAPQQSTQEPTEPSTQPSTEPSTEPLTRASTHRRTERRTDRSVRQRAERRAVGRVPRREPRGPRTAPRRPRMTEAPDPSQTDGAGTAGSLNRRRARRAERTGATTEPEVGTEVGVGPTSASHRRRPRGGDGRHRPRPPPGLLDRRVPDTRRADAADPGLGWRLGRPDALAARVPSSSNWSATSSLPARAPTPWP